MGDRFIDCQNGQHLECETFTSAPITVCGCACHARALRIGYDHGATDMQAETNGAGYAVNPYHDTTTERN